MRIKKLHKMHKLSNDFFLNYKMIISQKHLSCLFLDNNHLNPQQRLRRSPTLGIGGRKGPWHPGCDPQSSPKSRIRREKNTDTREKVHVKTAAAAAAKSLQSCPTPCDPTAGSPPGSAVPGSLQARTLEWVRQRLMCLRAKEHRGLLTAQKLREKHGPDSPPLS